MNIDGKIKEALARHESDVARRPGAWRDVEKRITRSHRGRMIGSTLGVALAIAGILVAIPRLSRHTIAPDASGWTEFAWGAEGIRFQHPQSWTVYVHGGFIEIAPRSLKPANGDLPFTMQVSLNSARFDSDVKGLSHFTRGQMAGRRYIRSETRMVLASPGVPLYWVHYRIDWPAPSYACATGGNCPYTLNVSIRSQTKPLEDRYGAVAERILQTLTPITSTKATRPRSPRVVGKIRADVYGITAGAGSLWGLQSRAASETPALLLRIDPTTKKTVARIPVGYVPQAIAADSDSVWVTNGTGCGLIPSCGTGGEGAPQPTFTFPNQNSVMRIDPRTNKVVASIRATEPQDVAIGFGSVWVTTGENGSHGTALLRIDPNANRVIATIPLGETGVLSNLAVGRHAVFVTVPRSSPDNGTDIVQVDPATNRYVKAAQVSMGSPVTDIATGFDSVWVTTSAQDTASALLRFDQDNSMNVGMIPLPDAAPVGLSDVTTGEGFVWAVSARGYLWKVDPATREHSDPTTIGNHPPEGAGGVVTGFGFVWVASDDGQIWQLSP